MKRKQWKKPTYNALLSDNWIKEIKEALQAPGFTLKPPTITELDSYFIIYDRDKAEKKNYKIYLKLIKEA